MAIDMNDEVSKAFNSIQLPNSGFTNGVNIVVNFDNENTRAEAAKNMLSFEQISTKSVAKM